MENSQTLPVDVQRHIMEQLRKGHDVEIRRNQFGYNVVALTKEATSFSTARDSSEIEQ